MTGERKTPVSRKNDNTITEVMNQGSREETWFPTSPNEAVCPPIWATACVPSKTGGNTSARMRCTVS